MVFGLGTPHLPHCRRRPMAEEIDLEDAARLALCRVDEERTAERSSMPHFRVRYCHAECRRATDLAVRRSTPSQIISAWLRRQDVTRRKPTIRHGPEPSKFIRSAASVINSCGPD